MPNTPSRNPYVCAASKILFGDKEWAYRSFMHDMMDYAFTNPDDGRLVSLNELAAELEAAANG